MSEAVSVNPPEQRFRDLVAAAQRLPESTLKEADDLDVRSLPKLRACIDASRQLLDTCHALLQQPCRVATEYDVDYYERHMGVISVARNLVRAFTVEAWLEWREGRRASAVACAIDAVRLGVAVRNGGLMTDILVGNCLSSSGTEFLRKQRHELDADVAANAAFSLMNLEDEREPFQTIVERDSEWERIVQPGADEDVSDTFDEDELDPKSEFIGQHREILGFLKEYAQQPKEVHRRDQSQIDRRQTAELRLLAIELAIISYHQRHGRCPTTLSALVPDLLDHVPDDPFSDRPFVFRPKGSKFVLYSVGPDGKDDGGRFDWWLPLCCAGGDLCLDHYDLRPDCNTGLRHRIARGLKIATRSLRRLIRR